MARRAQTTILRGAPALALIALALGCARRDPASARDAAHREQGRACSARSMPLPAPSAALPALPTGEPRVVAIELRGVRRVSPALVRRVIEHPLGSLIDSERVSQDVLAIWALEAFEDVSVSWQRRPGGISLVYELRERARIATVSGSGRERAAELGIEPGALYEPARHQSRARDLERSLIDAGHRRARVELSGASRGGAVELCVEIAPGPRALIDRLEFVGNQRVSGAVLRALMHTDERRINTPGSPYRAAALERDLLFISAAYYDRGMLGVRITPRVVERERAVSIAIEIEEGPVYRLGRLDVRGRLSAPAARYRELLGVSSGEVFSRQRFIDGIARIDELEAGKARVEPFTELHPERGLVDVTLELSEP